MPTIAYTFAEDVTMSSRQKTYKQKVSHNNPHLSLNLKYISESLSLKVIVVENPTCTHTVNTQFPKTILYKGSGAKPVKLRQSNEW